MPSINELFSAPGSEAEDDFELDMDKLMAGVDQSLAESKRFETEETPDVSAEEVPADVSPNVEPEPATTSVDEPAAQTTGGGAAGEEEAPEGTQQPPTDHPDPLGLLFAEEAKDPVKRERLLAALRDPAPQEAPAEQMPEEFAEDSVAARLWRENQETKARVDRVVAGQLAQAEAMAKQRAADAANAAGAEFAAKYAGRIDGDDVVRIAQQAGASGLAARLATGAEDTDDPQGFLRGAYMQALESTLWLDEGLRQKVLDPATPVEPTQAEVDKAESKPRKRKLTALSSSASPVSAPAAPKSALETRTDGRLTPQSRFSLVQEMATKLNRSNNEGGY